MIEIKKIYPIILFCLVIFSIVFIGILQGQEEPMETGYYTMVESLSVPLDITQAPRGTFVLFAKDGETEITRENVTLSSISTDEVLTITINSWANNYIKQYERKIALQELAATSQIIGVKIDHEK